MISLKNLLESVQEFKTAEQNDGSESLIFNFLIRKNDDISPLPMMGGEKKKQHSPFARFFFWEMFALVEIRIFRWGGSRNLCIPEMFIICFFFLFVFCFLLALSFLLRIICFVADICCLFV